MKKATYVIAEPFKNNRVFDLSDPLLNRDNCLYPYVLLREKFRDHGVDLATSDIHPPKDSSIVIYHNAPREDPASEDAHRSFLRINESEVIRPDNWRLERHSRYAKVFTWNDDLVDNQRYFKLNFPQLFPDRDMPRREAERFAVLIAGNKRSKHPKELYSERLRTIEWFEAQHPGEFDLYGNGWDEAIFSGRWRRLSRIKSIARLCAKRRPSYCGRVGAKSDVLSLYKFAICYENARAISGYITEKIFDCFFSGVVPVYWGPPNRDVHIPDGSYVDREAFSSHEELYRYLKSMSRHEYEGYRDRIQGFLDVACRGPFSAEAVAQTLVRETLE